VVNQEKRAAVKTGKRDQDFWLEYARQKNISLPKDWEDLFNQVMKDAIGVNKEMYDLVLELKGKGISVALLSNIDDRLARIIREFNLYAPFHPCLLSCEIGLEKPDPKIYEILLKEMNLPACSMIFIDDRAENIEAAEKLGFDAILFTSQIQLQTDLKKRGVL
jgi:putative hydrolase of the HAD superfamily